MDQLPVSFNPPPGFPPFIVQGARGDPVSQFVAMLLLPLLILQGLMAGRATGEGAAPLGPCSNEESWEIIRSSEGRIMEVVIHREVAEG